MGTTSSLAVGRFRLLPQRTNELWQGAVVALPMWIDNPADPSRPTRPRGALWCSLRSGRIHLAVVGEGDVASRVALDALIEFAKRESKLDGGRPSRVEVRDPALRDALDEALASTGTSVVLVPSVPAVEQALRELEASQGDPLPGFLDGTGVTIERLRAFADAAVAFHRARIWQHLSNDDLVVVESPTPPKALSHLCVMGSGGQQFGLAFFPTRAAFDKLMAGDVRRADRAYGLTFDPPSAIPFADLDTWDAHALPLAAPEAYPLFAEMSRSGGVRRPDARALTLAEALLRAFADTTETDLDAGRWQRDVATFDGRVTVVLSLPDILAETRIDADEAARSFGGPLLAEQANARISRILGQQAFGLLDEVNAALASARQAGFLDPDAPPAAGLGRPLTPLEQAQDLVYEAHETIGRRRIVLARRALALSDDCADAWCLLANAAPSPDETLALYEKAVDAGRRAIGERGFEELAGHFWGDLSTRPYMRARAGLAEVLAALGRFDEAIGHYEGLLALNPDDNQGNRYLLLEALLDAGRYEAAGALLGRFEDDGSAEWMYCRALLAFRSEGDTPAARAALSEAIRGNPHVARFIIDPDSAPDGDPSFVTFGSPDEAVGASDLLGPAFEEVAGVLDWLTREAARVKGPRSRKGARRGRQTRH